MHFLSINFICFNWVIPENRLKRLIQTHYKPTVTASWHTCTYGQMPVCETISYTFTNLKYGGQVVKNFYCWRLICCLFQHTQVPDIIEHAIDLGARRTDINKHFSTNLAQIGLCYTRLYTRRPSLGLNPLPWTVETECWQRGADRVCVWHLSSLMKNNVTENLIPLWL